MTTATRSVRFTPLRLDGSGPPTVASGYYQVRGSRSYDEGTGRVEHLWSPPIVISGTAVVKDLPVTPIDYSWALEVFSKFPDGRGGYAELTETVAVPAGSGTLDFEDLVRVTITGPFAVIPADWMLRIASIEESLTDGGHGIGTVVGTGPGGVLRAVDISDSSSVTVSFIQASTVGAARTAIGAGTSNLAIGTTAGTAADAAALATSLTAKADAAGTTSALAAKAPINNATLTGATTIAALTVSGAVTIADGSLAIADTAGLAAAIATAGLGNTVTIPGAIATTLRRKPGSGVDLPSVAAGCCVIWQTTGLSAEPTAFDFAGDTWLNDGT
jgi:hypothetical protein